MRGSDKTVCVGKVQMFVFGSVFNDFYVCWVLCLVVFVTSLYCYWFISIFYQHNFNILWKMREKIYIRLMKGRRMRYRTPLKWRTLSCRRMVTWWNILTWSNFNPLRSCLPGRRSGHWNLEESVNFRLYR